MAVETNTIPDTQHPATQVLPSMALLKGYVVRYLMQHFSNPRQIQIESLKGYTWAPDKDENGEPTTTAPSSIAAKLLITTRGKFDERQLNQRPAIVVKRGGIGITSISAFGSEVQGTHPLLGAPDTIPELEAIAGGNQYHYMAQTQFTCFCLGSEEVIAELLADEVHLALLAFRKFIMEELKLHEFMPAMVGEAGKIEEAKEHWACPVQISVAYGIQVDTKPAAPFLRATTVRANY